MLALYVPALGAVASAEVPGEGISGVIQVRVGQHETFDRVVLELDRDAPLHRIQSDVEGETVLEMQARHEAAGFTLPRGLARLRGVLLQDLPDGTRLKVHGKGPTRVFRLRDPPRVIVDVGDPGLDPFDPPEGAEPIELPKEEAAEEPLPTLGAASGAPPPTQPSEPAPSALAVPGAEEPTAVGAAPEELPAELPRIEEPSPEPATQPLPMPPPETPPRGRDGLPRRVALDLLIWVVGPLLVLGVGLYALRRRTRRVLAAAPPVRVPQEDISPEEIEGSPSRLESLEKRVDEEVRARVTLEQRVGQVHEDLKVVRDRVTRILRRLEGAS